MTWIFDELPDDLFDHIGSFCKNPTFNFIFGTRDREDSKRKEVYLMKKLSLLNKHLHRKYQVYDLAKYHICDKGILLNAESHGFVEEEVDGVNHLIFQEVPAIRNSKQLTKHIGDDKDYLFVWDPNIYAYERMHIAHSNPSNMDTTAGMIKTKVRNVEYDQDVIHPISLTGLGLNRSHCRGIRVMLRNSFWGINPNIQYETNGFSGISYYSQESVALLHNEDYVEMFLNSLFARLVQIADVLYGAPRSDFDDRARCLSIVAEPGFWNFNNATKQHRPIRIHHLPWNEIRNLFVSGIDLEFHVTSTHENRRKVFLRDGAKVSYSHKNERNGTRWEHLSIHYPLRATHEMPMVDLGQAANSIVIVNPGNLEIRARLACFQTRTTFINESKNTIWIRNDGGTIWQRRIPTLGNHESNRIPSHYRPIRIGEDPVPFAYYSSEDKVVVVFAGGKSTIMKVASMLQIPPPHLPPKAVLGKRKRKRDEDDVISIQSD